MAENLVNLAEAGRTSAPTIQKAITDLIQSDDVLLGIYEKTIRKRIEASEEEEKQAQAALERSMALQEDYIARAQKAQAEATKQDETDKASALERSMALQEALIARGQKSQAERDAERQAQEERAMALQEEMIKRGQEAQARRDEANHKARLKYMDLEAAKQVELGLVPYGVSMSMISGAVDIYKNGQKGKDKKGPKAPKDALVSLMQNLTLQKELLGVEEDRASVLQALGESRNKYTEEQIQRAVDLTEKIRLQTEALEQQKQVGDMVGQSFENAFMSIVDGTKSVQDAFRLMASDIIKELYRIFVVKKITGMISAAVGDATGLMSGDNPFSGYDGGGYTGSGPRSGGLDGKGGFMAMLHPRETVVDHTKGQSTGNDNVVINQTFSFAANGDESVRKIIAQEAPKISKMTEQSILDSRRRGGRMKAVFG